MNEKDIEQLIDRKLAESKSDKEVEQLIDRKLTESKLTVTEARLNYYLIVAGGLLTIFGLILPLWLSGINADKLEKAIEDTQRKTDAAIQQMDARFKELAGNSLRRPELECSIDGQSLDGGTLRFSPSKSVQLIRVTNKGDAPARNIHIRLYSNLDRDFSQDMPTDSIIFPIGSDEPSFKKCFGWRRVYAEPRTETIVASLDSKDFIYYQVPLHELIPTNVPGMIKMFYEQPDPKRVNFTIAVATKD